MTKTAWVFPGQGSQSVAMGEELWALPAAQDRLAEAEAILGWSVVDLCQDEEKLGNTRYTQPCLYTMEGILVDLLKEKQGLPDLLAGHSLGEYVALYGAGVFDFATGLNLVKQRAELMAAASGGKMAALMKFDRGGLETAIAETEGVVLANDNSEQQVVISGTPEAVAQILDGVKAKRAVELNVSGAFHSPFMAQAAAEFNQVLDKVEFKTPLRPVLSNVDPQPCQDGPSLKNRLQQQMTGSVRWREIMATLEQEGVTLAIEVGPGKVLSGLLKRSCKGMALQNVAAPGDWEGA